MKDKYAVKILEEDFSSGSLRQESNIRPNRLFTADTQIIRYRAGHLNDSVTGHVTDTIIAILTG